MDGWIRNGVAIHAVADQPAGPFSFHDVALPVFQHNPHAIKHPDGTYLLFGIGQANNASWQCPCKDGKPIMPDGKPTTDADAAPINHAQLHISKSPYGPWENVPGRNNADFIFEANNANPAPYICESASACLRRPSLPLTGLWTSTFLCPHLPLPLPLVAVILTRRCPSRTRCPCSQEWLPDRDELRLRHHVRRHLPWTVQ